LDEFTGIFQEGEEGNLVPFRCIFLGRWHRKFDYAFGYIFWRMKKEV
jgi:hypothetical protein